MSVKPDIRPNFDTLLKKSRERKAVPEFAENMDAVKRAMRLVDELAADSGEKRGNLLLSPASLYAALQMAAYAAAGDTRRELFDFAGEKVLHLDGEAVKSSNLFVVNQRSGHQASVKADYVDVLKTHPELQAMAAGLTDKNEDTLIRELNRLISDVTNGQISEALSPEAFREENFAALLADVIHFKGTWADGEYDVDPEFVFRTADGANRKVNALRMEDTAETHYYENDSLSAISVRYREDGGRYTFWGFLPEESDWKNLNMEGLREPASEYELFARIPKFRFESKLDTCQALQKFGLVKAFDQSKANFSGGFDFPENQNVFIGKVQQNVVIDFNEKGTEGSAVTQMQHMTTCMKMKVCLDFDRPFFFMIWDGRENVPLFVGQVCDPA